MIITVTRDTFTDKSTTGMLDLDGLFQCYLLELPRGTVKPCCIPAGTYQYRMMWSAHFQKVLPHVLNVPNFTDIELHIGNYPKDVKGCGCVGQYRAIDMVGNSELALDALLPNLPSDGTIVFVEMALPDPPEAT